MTQERIDLTQFEGIRKDWLYQEVKDSGNSEYATVNGGEFSDILFFIDRAEISEAELKALTMVPGLIAELKRCYEELELMVTYLRYMRDGELTDKDWLSVNELIGEEE